MIPRFLEKIHHQLFLNLADKILSNIKDERTSYSEFAHLVFDKYQKFNQITSHRIGIVLENNIDTYSAIIACWFCGKSYTPIQPKWPIHRINQICKIAQLDTLYSKNLIELPNNIHCFTAETLSSNFQLPIHIDLTNHTFNEAYVLFTSGTTGEPKGVSISFDNLNSFFEGFEGLNYGISREDRFLQMFDLTFDLSICSFMIPMIYGASFYTLNDQLVKPLALYDTLETHQITFALMIPSAIQLLENYLNEIDLPNLRITQFCGEALRIEQLNKWKSCVPHCQIDNVYGPTEATIYCTRYIAYPNSEVLEQNGIVCIGKPLTNTNLLVENESEILIGGTQVTNGYLNSNINNTAFQDKNGFVFYQSGDIGKKIEDNFYCLGRKDQQIKLQGYRIELSEIEDKFAKLFPNRTAVVIPKTDENNYTELVLFTISNPELSENNILIKLKMELPIYMIPRKVVFISEFKYNLNGKLDRNYLKQWTN